MSQPTALAALARTALEAAQKAGLAIDDLLQRSKLDRALIDDPEGRIAVVDLLRLWEIAAEMSGDPFFGLHAGEHVVSARTIHVVGYAARHSSTLGECYDHTVRFASITNEASEITLTREATRGIVAVGPRPGLPVWPRVYAEMAIAAYFSIGQRWVGQRLVPHHVTFMHSEPEDISEYQRLFGCQIRFNAPQNRLVLSLATLELPLASVDPDTLHYFATKAEAMLDEIGAATLEQRVRQEIAKLLGNQTPTLAVVGQRLAMSPRTLQRRLAEHDLQFNTLVDDVRRIIALRMMASRDADLEAIAERVGYRDLDSFRGAVQRWTGKTPRDYRRGS